MSGGDGTAHLQVSGGTLQADAAFATTLPMVLTGNEGMPTSIRPVMRSTLSGQLSGSGGLNKLGNGTLTLSNANTYNGPTIVSTGTLNVANTTGSATCSEPLR